MDSFHIVKLSKVERSQSSRPFWRKHGWWEWRGNGLFSLNNYHQSTLTMPFYAWFKLFLHRAAQRCPVCAAECGSKNGCVLKIFLKYEPNNTTQAARTLMRGRPKKLNHPGPFSPQFKNTMTRQEIDNVIAYFGAYLGQFVIFWQRALSLWIAALSIQTHWICTDKNEFCLTKLENERQESSMKCFHLGEKHNCNTTFLSDRKGTIRWIIHKLEIFHNMHALPPICAAQKGVAGLTVVCYSS